MISNIKKWNYGNYSSNNYGVHCLAFNDNFNNTYYFSYDTLIAFIGDNGLIIRKNVWGSTTGKHLNWIDSDKSKRVDKDIFNKELKELNKGA